MTVSTRARDIAVTLLLVACGAAAYHLLTARHSGKIHTHVHPIASKTASQVVQSASSIKVKRQAEVQGADRPAPAPTTAPRDGRTIATCYRAFRGLQRANTDCNGLKHPEQLPECQRVVVEDALFNQTMKGEAAACPSSLATPSGYYNALRAAAQLGDVSAQHCFITGYFGTEYSAGISQQQVEDYKRLANEYISDGLERGDWGVVQWLARLSTDVQDGLLLSAYPFGSSAPETLYKMNYLLTLGGATDAIVERPQSIVESLPKMGELSDQQVQDAQAWARDTYSKYFAATPYVAEPATSFCPSNQPK
jgi:hypothetical protein